MMHAIELNAQVTNNNEIHLKLSESVNCNKVKVIVMYELDAAKTASKRIFGQFEGAIRVSEDFDAELPDAFWTGQM